MIGSTRVSHTSAAALYLSVTSRIGVLSKRIELDLGMWVLRKFKYLQNKGTFRRNSVSSCGLRKFRNGASIVATCCQLSSTQVDTECDKLAAVVGRTKLTVLVSCNGRRSTDEFADFITPSVYSMMRVRRRIARVHLRPLTLADLCCHAFAYRIVSYRCHIQIGCGNAHFRTACIIDPARVVCGAGSMKRSSVRPSPSVPSIDSSSGVRRVYC